METVKVCFILLAYTTNKTNSVRILILIHVAIDVFVCNKCDMTSINSMIILAYHIDTVNYYFLVTSRGVRGVSTIKITAFSTVCQLNECNIPCCYY